MVKKCINDQISKATFRWISICTDYSSYFTEFLWGINESNWNPFSPSEEKRKGHKSMAFYFLHFVWLEGKKKVLISLCGVWFTRLRKLQHLIFFLCLPRFTFSFTSDRTRNLSSLASPSIIAAWVWNHSQVTTSPFLKLKPAPLRWRHHHTFSCHPRRVTIAIFKILSSLSSTICLQGPPQSQLSLSVRTIEKPLDLQSPWSKLNFT